MNFAIIEMLTQLKIQEKELPQRPNRLFFQRLNPGPTRELHMATIMHHGAVETAVFLSPSSHILTANGDGQIKMWDIISGAVGCNFCKPVFF